MDKSYPTVPRHPIQTKYSELFAWSIVTVKIAEMFQVHAGRAQKTLYSHDQNNNNNLSVSFFLSEDFLSQ